MRKGDCFCPPFIDLSLQISTPSLSSSCKFIEIGQHCKTHDVADSASNGIDLTQENRVSCPQKISTFNYHVASGDPTLSWGCEMLGLNHISMRKPRSTFHQTHGGGEFKRTSRMVINGIDHKRSTVRAPRMRWNSTLHSHFVQAVKLLGGHERATPKSVLELMDLKDLTLAHVKNHLQMYRTVKTNDKVAAHGSTDTGSKFGNHKGFEDEKDDNISTDRINAFIPLAAQVSSLDSNTTFIDGHHRRISWSSSPSDAQVPTEGGDVMELYGVEPEDDKLLDLEFTLRMPSSV